MANRTATLYIRIAKNGRSSFCKPVYQSKGRLKPLYAMVNDEPEHHPEGVYYLRCGVDGGKQQFVLIGKDSFVALDKLAEKQRWLRDRERQVAPQKPVNSKPGSSRISMDEESSNISGISNRKARTTKPSGRTKWQSNSFASQVPRNLSTILGSRT